MFPILVFSTFSTKNIFKGVMRTVININDNFEVNNQFFLKQFLGFLKTF